MVISKHKPVEMYTNKDLSLYFHILKTPSTKAMAIRTEAVIIGILINGLSVNVSPPSCLNIPTITNVVNVNNNMELTSKISDHLPGLVVGDIFMP